MARAVAGYPHLPPADAEAIAEFDAKIADGRLPLAADGHPAIPPEAESWIQTWLLAHLPADSI